MGAGKSGKSAKEFLENRGAEVELYGTHIDLVVASPGIRVTSELDLVDWSKCRKVVGVTGTNGKTSVVTMLKNAIGDDAVLCGNVGVPVTEVAKDLVGKIAIVEVSSFQLEIPPRNFKPDISVILNITQDHLDRHGNMEEYTKCKRRIIGKTHFENISNADAVRAVCQELKIKPEKVERAIREYETQNKAHRIEFVAQKGDTKFYNDSKATNIASTLFALAKLCGAFPPTPPLNDPKPTVNLILGGISKGQNFTELFTKLPNNVKNIFVFGAAREQIISCADPKKVGIYKTKNLLDAVNLASKTPADIVLFSPACSSFDMFKNYEDRGNQFKQIVASKTKA